MTIHFHDFAGDAATALTFASVLGFALLLGRNVSREARDKGGAAPIPGFDGVTVFGAFTAIPFLIWVWFVSIGGAGFAEPDRSQWTLKLSALAPGWSAKPFEPRPGEWTGLRFSTWQGYRLRSPEGWTAQIIHLNWKPGTSMPSLAFYHTPVLCMPWVGWTETGVPRKLSLPTHGGPIPWCRVPFRARRHRDPGSPEFIQRR